MNFDLSKIEYIDTHSHLQFKGYDENREDVISRMTENKVATICIGTDLEESLLAKKLSEENENIFYSVALHPHDNLNEAIEAFSNTKEYFEKLKVVANNEKCVAIGECGLDYFYIYKELSEGKITEEKLKEEIEKQNKIFRAHINLAIDLDLPLMLHIRPSEMNGNKEDAYLDVIEILKEYIPPTPEGGEAQNAIKDNFAWTMTDSNKYKILKELAVSFRKNKTKSEAVLWNRINNNQLNFHFRQQHIINNFIVDFVCLEKRLIIEIDGKIHEYQKESDEERGKILESFGFNILRFKNEDVLEDVDKVLNKINEKLLTLENRKEISPSGDRGIVLKGNFHFFVGTEKVLEKILNELENFTLSIPAVCTFTNEYDEMIKKIPLNKIHIETDSPFVMPKSRRKVAKQNEPSFVIDVFEKICEIKGIENKEEFKNILKENFVKMYIG